MQPPSDVPQAKSPRSTTPRSVYTNGLTYSSGKSSPSPTSKRISAFNNRNTGTYNLSADAVAGAYPPPPGVFSNETMNLGFSPPQPVSDSKVRSKYLSFLAPSNYPCKNSGTSDLQHFADRQLCVVNLQPFWEYIDSQQTITDTKSQRIPLPTTHHQHISFAKYHVQPLLCPTMTQMNIPRSPSKEQRCKSPQRRTNHHYHVHSSSSSSSQVDSRSSVSSSVSSTPSTSSSSRNQSPSPRSHSKPSATALKESPTHTHSLSLEERLRRERQRITISPHGMTQFSWTTSQDSTFLRILIPYQNSLYIQDGVPVWNRVLPSSAVDTDAGEEQQTLLSWNFNDTLDPQDDPLWELKSPTRWRSIYNQSLDSSSLQIDSQTHQDLASSARDKNESILCLEEESSPVIPRKRFYPEPEQDSIPRRKKVESTAPLEFPDKTPIDPQLSPDGSMVAFVICGDLYVVSCHSKNNSPGDDQPGIHHTLGDSEDGVGQLLPDPSQEDGEAPYPVQITFGAIMDTQGTVKDTSRLSHPFQDEDVHSKLQRKKRYGRAVMHGLADYVAQEEMERYHGFWWSPDSKGILFDRVDESYIPPFRIMHHSFEDQASFQSAVQSGYEDHRYPFAGEVNAQVTLGYVDIDRDMLLANMLKSPPCKKDEVMKKAKDNFDRVKWFHPPDDASEYLAAVNWLQEGNVIVQWQNRAQTTLLFVLLNVTTGQCVSLCKETSDSWINLNHIFVLLPRTIDPEKYFSDPILEEIWSDTPDGSFSFLIASERTGYCHIYLYTYRPGDEFSTLIRPITTGNWIVESIDGIDLDSNVVYVSGTYDSALEKHLYAVALLDPDADMHAKVIRGEESRMRNSFWQVFGTLGSSTHLPEPVTTVSIPRVPLRLTQGFGMHHVILDSTCRIVVDTCSDLNEPTSTRIFYLPPTSQFLISRTKTGYESPWMLYPIWTLHDAHFDAALEKSVDEKFSFSPPEIIPFASSDPSCMLYAALYRPDPHIYGNGPYPLICSVYGGPRVQRVNRSWQQTIDLRAQHLCSLGFAVVKCDNHGSSRRGKTFETAIKGQLGDVEVLDQAQCVRMLIMRGIADPSRVGVYGWSYGGYLAAMCLCQLPDVFQVAISGAPVTNWLGYDTHYTERYLGLPTENEEGYRKSSISEHIQNMKGRLLIIHGLIDENVHWRHSANLINQLTAAGKLYDLCVFPDERHSPRKLKNRIYLEHKISDYFLEHLRVMREGSAGTVGRSSPDAKPFGRL